MASMRKTTMYLDDELYQRVKALAQARGATQALVIRDAIAAYVAHDRGAPRSVGMGRSGSSDLSERAEELLAGMGDEP
jgi:metal-responsive CopG/Arc/MetJ family transcriptional regulator